MKVRKRLIALLMLFALVALLFAGCGSGGSSTESTGGSASTEAPATEAPAPTETPAEPAEPTGLTLPLTEETVTFTIQKSINATAAQYMEGRTDHPVVKAIGELTNVYLEFSDIPSSNAQEQFNVLMAGGDYPDYIGDMQSYYTAGIDDAIDQDIIVDIAPYLDTLAADYAAALDACNYRTAATTDSGRMGCFFQLADRTWLDQGYIIRKDWLDQVGMDVPVTYDDLHDALYAFVTELGVTGGPFFTCNLVTWPGNALGDGWDIGTLYKPGLGCYPYSIIDGQVIFGWTADAYKECLEMYARWWDEGLVWKDFAASNAAPMIAANQLGMEAVANGTLGVFWGEINDLSSMPQNMGIEVVPMASPVREAGQTLHVAASVNDVALMGGVSVSTDCADPELAIAYMSYWYTEEACMLENYGIEGQTYDEVDANGVPVFNDLILNNPDDIPFKVLMNVYCMETFVGVLYVDRNLQAYDEASLAASDVWASNRDGAYKWTQAATMTPDESGLWSTKFADISTYATEMTAKFITGEADLAADWDEYIATLEGLGAEDCTACFQAAYDRYIQR